MKISTRSLYAVMALVDLALHRKEGLVSLPEIADRQGLSLAYLEQIFMILRKEGLVSSLRGQKGGYGLTRSAGEITLAAIFEAMGEMPRIPRGQRRDEKAEIMPGFLPNETQYLTHRVWAQLETHIAVYLQKVSLADICTPAGKKKIDARLNCQEMTP